MSTRGIWGIKLGEVTKQIYNHSDSYPTGLGMQIFKAIRLTTDKLLIRRFKKIEVITGKKKPTKIQQARYTEFSNLSVSECSLADWYSLLRESHYNPEYYLTGHGGGRPIDHMIHAKVGGWEEFIYTIDLDTLSVRCLGRNREIVFDMTFDGIRECAIETLEEYLYDLNN